MTRLALLALLLASPARAQTDDPHAVAERVHESGQYASDITPADGESAAPHRAPRHVDGDRDPGDLEAPPSLPEIPWLRRLLDALAALLEGVAGPLGYLFAALGFALIAALVAYLITRMRLPIPRATATPGSEAGGGELDPMLAAPAMAEEDLAAQGRWREAIHALFVRSLDRIGGAEGRLRARTARELVHRVPPATEGRGELEELLGITELVWFGGRDATETQYRSARALAARVPARASEEAA